MPSTTRPTYKPTRPSTRPTDTPVRPSARPTDRPPRPTTYTSARASQSSNVTSIRSLLSRNDGIISLSSKDIQNTFKNLYKIYKKLNDATKDTPEKFLLKSTPKEFMVKKKLLNDVKTINNVLYPPYYDKILPLKYDDKTLYIDTSTKYVMLHKYKDKELYIINVTPEFLKWFYNTIKLREILNKAKIEIDYIQTLPHELIPIIGDNLPLMSRENFRRTSTTTRNFVKPKKLPYYLKTNHPNFIDAFISTLEKYNTTKSEKEILKEHENDLIEYKRTMNRRYGLRFVDEAGIFPRVIAIYFKLLNASNMNPRYICNLTDIFNLKTMFIKYERESKEFRIDKVILHELYKIYLTMYLSSSDKSFFNKSYLEQSLGNTALIGDHGLSFVNDTIKIIHPLKSEQTIRAYLYIDNYIEHYNLPYRSDMYLLSEPLSTFKENWKEDTESPLGIIVPIPPEIKNMKELIKHPVGIQLYENCVKHVMTPEYTKTNYTAEGRELNLLSGFGL